MAAVGRKRAHRAIDVMLAKMTPIDRAALAMHWPTWARGKQVAPAGPWVTWGFLAGRGFGKTCAVSKYVNAEAEAGRAMLIGLAAQDEDNCVKLQVLGPSGLIATSAPWFRPRWEASRLELVWPNGARAMVRTPEVPDKIRGPEFHLAWLSEVQSWPETGRDKAWSNFKLATRLGYARTVWDATPRKRHPTLIALLRDNEADPVAHVVVRGSTRENAANLAGGYVARLEAEYAGTQRGREELGGEMLQESDAALVRAEWIDTMRRMRPDVIVRRVVAIDPAVTTRGGSDMTGIVDVALGADGIAYVMGDHTAKHTPPEWAAIVLDVHARGACDLVIVETNKGGLLLTQNLRAAAKERGLKVAVVDDKWRPHRSPGVVFVREVYGRGSKSDRAQPLATAYERRRIAHVFGADLTELEATLTTWEPLPGVRSPDRLDPLVYGVGEVLGLSSDVIDHAAGFAGLAKMGAALPGSPTAPRGASRNIAALLGGGAAGGGRI